jgi:hypothetical protein
MAKRDDLAKRLAERNVVKVENPIEAIAASLKQESQDIEQQAILQEGVQEDMQKNVPARTHARTHEGKQTRKPSPGETYSRKVINIDMLYDQIQQRKHLSNGSFRYRADELENMDAIFRELEALKPGRISKNDIARMALVTLCHDYQENGEESVLAQVFKRM